MSTELIGVARPIPEQPGDHVPERPSWDCGKCGQTWPCANAKSDLLCEHFTTPSGALVRLALHMWEAFDDFAARGQIPPDLRERFIGWVRDLP
ncbi:hypothetical protein [Actinoplanes sp. NPDC026670]|uniref:hypothetical protein n=1 Tax=Actinoplanes sp. NPDC026670 TaxID=3154700 RepID=UPI0033CAE438